MNKILLSSCFLFFFLSSINSQITIKRENFGINTSRVDSGRLKFLTKKNVSIPSWGNNQVWDYSMSKDSQTTIYSNYFVPAINYGVLPNAFLDASLATNFRTVFNSIANYPSRAYQKLDSSGFYKLGFTTAGAGFSLFDLTREPRDSLVFFPDTTRYNSKVFIYKFPMTVNSAWKNKYSDVINYRISIAALGLNGNLGQRVVYYNSIDTVVGWGTLRLNNPSGGANLEYAVLLLKSFETRIDSFYLDGQPTSDTFLQLAGLVQGEVSTTPTIYRFLGIGFKLPFMYLSYNSNGAISSLYRSVLPEVGLTVRNEEYENQTIKHVAFPNPAYSEIFFDFYKTNSKTWNILISNSLGQLITTNAIDSDEGLTRHSVKLNDIYSSGLYFYNIVDENSLIRAKGSFVVTKK